MEFDFKVISISNEDGITTVTVRNPDIPFIAMRRPQNLIFTIPTLVVFEPGDLVQLTVDYSKLEVYLSFKHHDYGKVTVL